MKLHFVLAFVMLAAPAFGQALSGINGDCQVGGQQALVSGLPSTATQQIGTTNVNPGAGVQASFPKCLVTVYASGTANKANIYSNNTLTPTVLSNPFVANTDGSFTFFSAAGCYDVSMSSGAGPALPYVRTLSGICVGQGTVTIPGGSGTVGACGTPGALAYYSVSGTTVTCDPNFITDGSGNAVATSMTFNGAGAGFVGFVQGTVPPLSTANTAYLYSDTSIPTTFGTVLPTTPGTVNQVLTVIGVVDATHIKTGWVDNAALPGCAEGVCIQNSPSGDQTISGAHALTLSDTGSTFLEKGAAGIGPIAVPGGSSSLLSPIPSTILDVEKIYDTNNSVPTEEGVFVADWNGSVDQPLQTVSAGRFLAQTDPSSTNALGGISTLIVESYHQGSGNSGAGGGFGALDVSSFDIGSGNLVFNAGVFVETGSEGAGVITDNYGIYIQNTITPGKVTHDYGLHIDPQGGLASGFSHAIDIADQGSGANDYGIFEAGSTHNDLGGGLTKVGSLTASTPIAVASGGSGTAAPSIVAGTNVTVSGAWPNQTINASGTLTTSTCIDARNYTATGGDFAVQINSALTAAVAVGGPHCVDARGVVTPVWMNTNSWAGISSPANVYWPMGKIYVSVPQVTPATTVQGNFGQGGSPQATVMPNFAGTQFIACNSTGPEGCGTDPNSFANFTAGTTMPGHGPLTGTNTNPVWVIGGANAVQPTECFDCRLENIEIDSNLIANGVCYYTYSAEEGSTFRDSDCNNALLACAVYDRGDRSPGTGHYTYSNVQCSTPKATTAGKYGVIMYGGNGSGTAAGPAYFGGSTFHGTSAFPMQNDGIYIDDISSATINQIHFEYITGYGVNAGPSNTTKNVQVSVNGANTLTAGLVHFGTHTDASDNVQDVNVSGTQNIVVDDLAGVTLTGSTFPKLNFWYAGQGFSTVGTTVFAYCTGTIGATNATAYYMFPSNSTGVPCVQTSVSNIKMPQPCLANNFQFQSRVAPTTAATFTFNKNGVSQFTGTWTGASTTFTDTTHFVLFNLNDTWSISVTTGQATDTQADIRGTFACR